MKHGRSPVILCNLIGESRPHLVMEALVTKTYSSSTFEGNRWAHSRTWKCCRGRERVPDSRQKHHTSWVVTQAFMARPLAIHLENHPFVFLLSKPLRNKNEPNGSSIQVLPSLIRQKKTVATDRRCALQLYDMISPDPVGCWSLDIGQSWPAGEIEKMPWKIFQIPWVCHRFFCFSMDVPRSGWEA